MSVNELETLLYVMLGLIIIMMVGGVIVMAAEIRALDKAWKATKSWWQKWMKL